MIAQVTLEDLTRNMLGYLQRVQAGETIVVVQAGTPMAEIKPILPIHGLRPYGLCEGEFSVPVDFDEPLPEAILRDFEAV